MKKDEEFYWSDEEKLIDSAIGEELHEEDVRRLHDLLMKMFRPSGA